MLFSVGCLLGFIVGMHFWQWWLLAKLSKRLNRVQTLLRAERETRQAFETQLSHKVHEVQKRLGEHNVALNKRGFL